MHNRWNDWLRQAEDDLLWAKDTLELQRYAQACFTAQQVGEKALKSLALKRGYDVVRSHSLREIAAMLEGRSSAVYLFGSFNTDKFSRHSDVDLFIITETDVPFVERPLLFNDLLDAFPSLDILVYTPDEFRALTSAPSLGFWSFAASNMKRIV